MTVGDREHTLHDLERENGFVTAVCDCTVALTDTNGEPSALHLSLKRDGDRLYGSATIVSTAPRTNFSFPAYVQAKKASNR